MKIYINTKKDTILAAKIDKRLISTRSSYFESFFKSLSEKQYGFFDFNMSGVKSANEKEIVFFASTYDDFGNMPRSRDQETYIYIGEASNYEELKQILKNNPLPKVKKRKTLFSRILLKI